MSDVEYIEKTLSIFLSFVLLFNAFFIKKKLGSLLIPGALFSLFWFCYMFFPLIFLFRVPISVISSVVIVISVVLFSNTCFLFKKEYYSRESPLNKLKYNFKFLKTCLGVLILLSLSFTSIQLVKNGIYLRDFLKNPIESAEVYSKLRYSLRVENTIFNALSLISSYLSALIGGLIYFSSSKKFKTKYFISFIPAIYIMLSQSAKGSFFLSIFMFLGSGYAVNAFKNHAGIEWVKVVKSSAKYVFVILVLLLFSFFSRGFSNLKTSQEVIESYIYTFNSYFFGHFYAFSDWLSNYFSFGSQIDYKNYDQSFGYYTFNSLTRYLYPERNNVRGVYSEYFVVGDNQGLTCVYTYLRGLLTDFGTIGSIVLIFVIGGVVHKIFLIHIRKPNPTTVTLLIFTICGFYMSFLGSILYWLVIPVTAFCLLFLLLTNKCLYVKK